MALSPFPVGDEDGSPDLRTRFQQELDDFRRSDNAREDLMRRLLEDNIKLHQQLSEIRDDYNNEKDSRRRWQSAAEKITLQLRRANDKLEDNPFALVLLDGDGCIFHDKLLRAVAEGGAEAAHTLHQDIKHLLQDKEVNPSCTVKVDIYLSLDDLSRKLAAVGILDTAGSMYSFVHAFNLAQPLFSIVDVGRGKERADHKIKEMFRLFVNNSHCKHIIFGGCHDNGYLPNLEPFKRDKDVNKRVTLLQTTPAEYAYQSLGFPICQFPSVFRSEPLPDSRSRQYSPSQTYASLNAAYALSPSATSFIPGGPSNSNPMFSPLNIDGRNPTPPSTITSPTATQPPPGLQRPAPPTHTSSSTTNGTIKSPSPAPTWATVGGPPESKNISIAPAKPLPQRKSILYNADNCRVDDKLPKPDAAAEARLKLRVQQKGKLCNNFHLKGKCANGPNCQYGHEPALSDGEKLAFRHRVRTTVCPRGLECMDFHCYLGHCCPNPNCARANCFFEELHSVDPVAAMKVYEDGDVDIIKD